MPEKADPSRYDPALGEYVEEIESRAERKRLVKNLIDAMGETLTALGFGWEVIVTYEGRAGEQVAAHVTTPNPYPPSRVGLGHLGTAVGYLVNVVEAAREQADAREG